MTDAYYTCRDALLGGGYRLLVKPIFFKFDPESVHDVISAFGARLGHWPLTQALTRVAFDYDHPMLRTTVAGIPVKNPFGLSAGFDKEGRLVDILPHVGFGFMEIGSITGTPCAGNAKPRLWRLPKSKGLVVYLGLNSSGAASIAQRLRSKTPAFPWMLSMAKANVPELDGDVEGIADYVKAARALDGLGAIRVINISCPNTTGGEPFQEPAKLDRLLSALDPLLHQPVFIKMPAERDLDKVDALVDVATRHNITGFICTNLSSDRSNPLLRDAVVPPKGGLSGKLVEQTSNTVLSHIYRSTGGRMTLIGVGGIFTAEDAYRKIRLGASVVQLITGMIYRGPSAISEMKRGLVRLLKRDGFATVADAVGVDAR